MRQSKVLKKLQKGEYVLSVQIASAFAPFAGIAAQVGFDCVWLDAEHKPTSDTQIRECILACSLYDCDTVVRIRKRGYVDYFRPLEDGATGIMVPHCKSKEEAEFAVYNTKFYPVGMRGTDFTGLSSDYVMSSPKEATQHALENTFTMVQIEDVEALEQIDEIAAVDGVDLLFLGPSDLTQSAKRHGVFHENYIDDAYKKINEAVCKTKDTWWGTVCVPDKAQSLIEKGCRFLNTSGDFGAVSSGLKSFYNKAKGLSD